MVSVRILTFENSAETCFMSLRWYSSKSTQKYILIKITNSWQGYKQLIFKISVYNCCFNDVLDTVIASIRRNEDWWNKFAERYNRSANAKFYIIAIYIFRTWIQW